MRNTHRLIILLLTLLTYACGDTRIDGNDAGVGSDSGADISAADTMSNADGSPDTITPDATSGPLTLLSGIEPSLPDTDLEALGALIGDTPVVGLGESVHTTREYSRIKVRIFQYLVEKKGFRVFAFENPWQGAEAARQFVDTCTGGADAAMNGLFGVWANQSVRDLLVWMCGWNTQHPNDKVSFWGFDVQQPEEDKAAIASYVTTNGLNDAGAIAELSNCLGTQDAGQQKPLSEAVHLACYAALDALDQLLVTNQATLVAADAAAYEYAKLRIIGIRSWEDSIYFGYFNTTPGVYDLNKSFGSRDQAMAAVFLKRRELENPGQKVALWAHNTHLQKHLETQLSGTYAGIKGLGDYLNDTLASDYFVLGFLGREISLNWPNIQTQFIPAPTDPTALENLLQPFGSPLLIDLHASGLPFDANTPQKMSEEHLRPALQYDALIYFETVAGMVSLWW